MKISVIKGGGRRGGGLTPSSKCHFKIPYFFNTSLTMYLCGYGCCLLLWFVTFSSCGLYFIMYRCALSCLAALLPTNKTGRAAGQSFSATMAFLLLEVVDINLVDRSFEFTETFAVPKTFFPLK